MSSTATVTAAPPGTKRRAAARARAKRLPGNIPVGLAALLVGTAIACWLGTAWNAWAPMSRPM